jgi:hypothetical protein
MKPSYDVLPDGSTFAFWDCATMFAKVYHVAQGHPRASDDGPGTEEVPFRTINRAAQVLQPGQRVLIGAGVYRECVRPARGGAGAEQMISYEAAPGAQPVISAAEVWQGPWEPSEGWRFFPWVARGQPSPHPRVWRGHLPPASLPGYNPFGMCNAPSTPWSGDQPFFTGLSPWASKEEFLMRRGMLFVDGKPMRQVGFPCEKGLPAGAFWVEDSGLIVHFRLSDDSDPKDHVIEFTAREQCFSPAVPYQGYIRVKGLAFEKAGNGLPAPQRGALSTFCGHHWIVEDNAVRWANSLGIDVGHQAPQRASDQLQGHHVIRRNAIIECGVCGLAGVGAARLPEAEVPDPLGYPIQISRTLIEHNRFERNCWHNVECLFESGAIKLHSMHDCLVRHNVILDNKHGSGIWADWQNVNTRICANVIADTEYAQAGAIFVEASKHPNLVDNNVIWNVGTCPSVGGDPVLGGNGIYEHDCDQLTVRHNFVHGASRAAIMMNLGDRNRMVYGRGSTGRRNRVLGNLLDACRLAIVMPNPDNTADGNLFGAFSHEAPLRVQNPEEKLSLPAWQEFHGWDRNGKNGRVRATLDRVRLILSLQLDDGVQVREREIDLTQAFCLEGFL